MRKLLIGVISALLTLIVLEIGLRTLDPWGAHTYYSELNQLKRTYVPDSQRGYTLPPGQWQFRHWQATMTDAGRWVPDTHPSACTVALIGDSVTFGFAVNDADTFANRLAQRLPGVTVRNDGVPGYNAAQVMATADGILTADVVVYLLVSNDADPALTPDQMHLASEPLFQALTQYIYHWRKTQPAVVQAASGDEPVRPNWFWAALATMRERGVIRVGFAGDGLAEQVSAHDATLILIPGYQTRISYADPHPDPAGHERIATALTPRILQAVEAACPQRTRSTRP